jgi:hypothetical protein
MQGRSLREKRGQFFQNKEIGLDKQKKKKKKKKIYLMQPGLIKIFYYNNINY